MEKLKVKFVDFWVDMNKPESNYFYELLSQKYRVEFSDKPDIVFYSCFGKEYLKYTCTRIFYSPENWRPDFSQCDYAITFDYLNDNRHLRLPLWALYYMSYTKNALFQKHVSSDNDNKFQQWANRKNFCCFMVSNGSAKERIEFYNRLNSKLPVDSAGQWNNTIGRLIPAGTENKIDFIKGYRYVISFENASHAGYTTEKIVEPMLAGCIPIYWGDPEVKRDFNEQRFINVNSVNDFDETINLILDLENNKHKAQSIIEAPIFPNNELAAYVQEGYGREQLLEWVEKARSNGFKGVGAQMGGRFQYYSLAFKTRIRKLKNKIMQ